MHKVAEVDIPFCNDTIRCDAVTLYSAFYFWVNVNLDSTTCPEPSLLKASTSYAFKLMCVSLDARSACC